MRTLTPKERRNWISGPPPSNGDEAEADHPPPELVDLSPSTGPTARAWTHPRSSGRAPGTAGESWDDWRWQLRNRIRTTDELLEFLPGLKSIDGLAQASARFPLAMTPYYASLIAVPEPSDPVFQMAVPQVAELHDRSFLLEDPLSEDEDMPVPGLIHRYRDRALLIATSTCSVYCRHCTRKRVAGFQEGVITPGDLAAVIDYLRGHPEIRDVIISGGDPLTLSTAVLEQILCAVRGVDSVEIIRVGTRTPVVLPMRITTEVVDMLRRYHPLFINTHFNHPVELTSEAGEACRKLVDAGIPVGNQTVLLRGVNDSPPLLERLFRGLLRFRVRPYYLFQCDLVRGVEHFRTPISKGIEIMEYLRGRVSGLAIPTFVVDAPQGGGKIPVMPNYVVTMSPTHTVLRNFEGMIVSYPEPNACPEDSMEASSKPAGNQGVWEVSVGIQSHLLPQHSDRASRRSAARRLTQ